MDHRSVRLNNLAVVFQEVLRRGPRSRAQLAKDTGLNKTTVSSLVSELLEAEMLVETEIERGTRVGRPSQIVDVNGERILGLGLEAGRDYVAVCLKDLFGRVIAERYEASRNHEVSPETLARRLAGLAGAILEQWLAKDAFLAGATIAVPGLVDRDGGHVLLAPALGLEQVPLGALVERELRDSVRPVLDGVAVRVDNEANLGALAEHSEGAGHDLGDFVYVSGGAGVNAGIVISGELLRGSEGFAGQIGHLPVGRSEEPCSCGAEGCLEQVVRESLIRLVGAREIESSPSDTMNVIRDTVAARLRAREPEALEARDELVMHLGVGFAAVANLLNPQAVILGGYFSVLSEWVADDAEAEMRRRVVAGPATDVQLRVAVLGGYAPLRGAAIDALSNVLNDPRFNARLSGEPVAVWAAGHADQRRAPDAPASRRLGERVG